MIELVLPKTNFSTFPDFKAIPLLLSPTEVFRLSKQLSPFSFNTGVAPLSSSIIKDAPFFFPSLTASCSSSCSSVNLGNEKYKFSFYRCLSTGLKLRLKWLVDNIFTSLSQSANGRAVM